MYGVTISYNIYIIFQIHLYSRLKRVKISFILTLVTFLKYLFVQNMDRRPFETNFFGIGFTLPFVPTSLSLAHSSKKGSGVVKRLPFIALLPDVGG
jgi:hypothetical protein